MVLISFPTPQQYQADHDALKATAERAREAGLITQARFDCMTDGCVSFADRQCAAELARAIDPAVGAIGRDLKQAIDRAIADQGDVVTFFHGSILDMLRNIK